MATPAIQIPLIIAIAPFPEGFAGDMDETFQQAVQLMTGYIEGNFLLGQILPPGSTLPTTDQGPIAMDGIWYFWNDATGEYEPQMFPVKATKNYAKNCVYQVQQTGSSLAVPAGGGPGFDMTFIRAPLVNILSLSSINGPNAGTNNDDISTAANYTVGPGVVAAPLATDLYAHEHLFEGTDIAMLRGQVLSLSFWAYGLVPGTYSVYLASAGRDESYVAAFSLATANHWTWITVPGIPAFPTGSGTWNWTEGQTGLYVGVPFAVGTNRQISTSNLNKWLSTLNCGTNQNVNLLATVGNTLAITGIKLEAAASPTYLSVPAFEDELEALTRYYFTTFGYYSPGAGVPVQFFADQDNSWVATFIFPRRMALNPVVTPYSWQTQAAGLLTNMFSNIDIAQPTLQSSRRGITDSGVAVINTSGTLNSTTTITLVATQGVNVGAGVSGVGIPAGATVTKILSSTSLMISAAATATAADVALTFTNFPVVIETTGTTSFLDTTGDIAAGSTTVTLEGASSGISVGAPIIANGIPAGATVASAPTGGTNINTTGNCLMNRRITNIPSTTGVVVGMEASGTGIQQGSLVASVDSSSQVTLDRVTTLLTANSTVNFSQDKTITISVAATATVAGGDLSFGSKKVTNIPDTSQLSAGMPVSGLGIPTGTTIASVNSSTQVTLSQFATVAGTNIELVFGGGLRKGDLLWAIITADARLT